VRNMPDTHMSVKHMLLTPWARLVTQSTICVMNIDEALGKAIRKHRKLANTRQEDLPVDQGNLSKIENGKQSLSMEKLVELATALRTTPSEIWATAEDFMRPESAGATAEREAIEAGKRSEYQVALAGVVEGVIATTPGAAPALLAFLRKSLALAKTRSDRKVLQALVDRVESVHGRSRAKSGASRARAPAGSARRARPLRDESPGP
jgi:transcriptional regulator with XRE-family HTH domain